MRFAAFLIVAVAAHAAVRRVEILDRTPIVQNYERIIGRVYFGADPKLPANRIVRDLESAPVNSREQAAAAPRARCRFCQRPSHTKNVVVCSGLEHFSGFDSILF
jgi:hypothetical protein